LVAGSLGLHCVLLLVDLLLDQLELGASAM
jgi:hypothetical protein